MSETSILYTREYRREFGKVLLAELRESFGCQVWLDLNKARLRFPVGYTPSAALVGFIKGYRTRLVEALNEERDQVQP